MFKKTSHDTALVYFSTEQLTNRTVGKTEFQFGINNSVYLKNVRKIVPQSISLPNIFPNVNSHRNSWVEPSSGTPKVLDAKQYTTSTLVTALNSKSTDFTFSVDANGYFNIACTGTKSMDTSANTYPKEIFEMLGFQDDLESNGTELSIPTSIVASNLPNLGGEKKVFISSAKLAQANCIHGGDDTPYDILTVISFHDVGFGFEANYRAEDMIVGDVEYDFANQLDKIHVTLLDSKFRPLYLPTNYHLRMVLKIFHMD